MLTRIRETEDGYKVTIFKAEGIIAERETGSLSEAFGLQAHVQQHGHFPASPRHDPEIAAINKRGNLK